MSLVQDTARTKGLELSLSVDDRLPPYVVVDALRLQQVILNLVSNAVKFTSQGRVGIAVKAAGSELLIEVSDTGLGMSAEQVSRLFLPFEQADPSTTRRYGGTGLGLAITKRLLALMKGSIEVSSRPGEGSVFTAHLPLLEACAPSLDTELGQALAEPPPETDATTPTLPTSANAAPGLAQPMGHPARLSGLRLLVAEDNAINQLVIDNLLATEGAHVDMVIDGYQAIEMIQVQTKAPYHLLLLDVMMPGIDGYETARRVQLLDPSLPIIGQTAHALEEDRLHCLKAGMRDRITKPIDPETLVRTVLRHARTLSV